MKRESQQSSPPSLANKKAKDVNNDLNAAPNTAPESNSEEQKKPNKMAQWFAQIGITSEHAGNADLTLQQKVNLRAQILAKRKIENLENILAKAIDFCLDDSKSGNIDPDWFFNFIQMAEDIHSPVMQELWGKIFAVETAKSGSFSLKTLALLKRLTHKDALLFRHAVNLSCRRKGETSPKLLTGYAQKVGVWSLFQKNKTLQINLAEFGLGYPELLSLMDLGLIHTSEIESSELLMEQIDQWQCGGQNLQLKVKKAGTTLTYYKFTHIGTELLKLVTRNKNDKYASVLKNTLGHAFYVN